MNIGIQYVVKFSYKTTTTMKNRKPEIWKSPKFKLFRFHISIHGTGAFVFHELGLILSKSFGTKNHQNSCLLNEIQLRQHP